MGRPAGVQETVRPCRAIGSFDFWLGVWRMDASLRRSSCPLRRFGTMGGTSPHIDVLKRLERILWPQMQSGAAHPPPRAGRTVLGEECRDQCERRSFISHAEPFPGAPETLEYLHFTFYFIHFQACFMHFAASHGLGRNQIRDTCYFWPGSTNLVGASLSRVL